MSDFLCYAVGITFALGVIVVMAFPERILPEAGPRKKRFTGRHWGRYHDTHETEDAEEHTVECGIPARKSTYVIGSRTYSGGRK
ncbi:MAG: hypothetical protein K2X77_32880 [Candidatus Obscuribacterales bacterium]|jgi:hypothetical protein|nr:hypothetical protein [Candidatus Obscuribacterales bacterium]